VHGGGRPKVEALGHVQAEGAVRGDVGPEQRGQAAPVLAGGKWKGLILFWFGEGPLRFGELRRTVSGISERMLILQLRELEASGLVYSEVHHHVPPQVEYSLTDFGHSLVAALVPLGQWGEEHMERLEVLP
jgi:DNA-binding HxlR family transcriptional regulator